MTDVPYPYASGDLLEDRHAYFFTDYKGRPFLNAWRAQRGALKKELPDPSDPPVERADDCPLMGDAVNTDVLLGQLFAAICDGRDEDAVIRDWLVKLVNKFEVTKRVHGGYDSAFRAVDPADHKDPTNYLRLAEVLEAAYTAMGDIAYINALLKCLDTLSTLADQLTESEKARLAKLIDRERRHVEEMAKKMKVVL